VQILPASKRLQRTSQTMELGILLVLAYVILAQLFLAVFGDYSFKALLFFTWLYLPTYFDSKSNNGSRQWKALRESEFVWSRLKSLFGHVIIDEHNTLASTKAAIYACHPHGVISLSVGLTFISQHTEDGKNITTPRPLIYGGAFKWIFYIPLLRDVFYALGCVSVDWVTLNHHLNKGHNIALIPEGVRGIGKSLTPNVKDERFLRRAFDHQITVVPVYCHNEDSVCKIWEGEWFWITWIRRFFMWLVSYPFPSFFFGPWPRARLVTCIGEPHYRLSNDTFASFCERYWESLQKLISTCSQAKWTF